LIPASAASRPPAHPAPLQAGKTVTIELGDTTLRVIDSKGELITTVAGNGGGRDHRFKTYGTRRSP